MDMLFENYYYEVVGREGAGDTTCFHIRLLPDCTVYRGHFPGHPVSPGVFNIETIRELAMRVTGRRLLVRRIRQCRFIAVVTPDETPRLDVNLRLTAAETGWLVDADIADAEKTYMTFRGEMMAQETRNRNQ